MKRRSFCAASACGVAALAIPGIVTAMSKPETHSELATKNINFLLRELDHRIERDGVPNLFPTDTKVNLLANALSMINETPPFTCFTFEDTGFVRLWTVRIAEGAKLMTEVMINAYLLCIPISNPPKVSEILTTRYDKDFQQWCEENREVKIGIDWYKPWGR
jgi:hypothetical protein